MKKITGTDMHRIFSVLGIVMGIILILMDGKNVAIGLILMSTCSASLASCKKSKNEKIEKE